MRKRTKRKRTGPKLHFYCESGIVLSTGVKAEDLQSLLNGLKTVTGSSIFYHVYDSFFRRHFTASDHMNDFARWAWGSLEQKALAEKLAAINPMEFNSVRQVRERLISIVRKYVGDAEVFLRVPEHKAFYFSELKSFVVPIGKVAQDLKEFIRCVRHLSRGSLFYHLIEARIRLGQETNDFSVWLNRIGKSRLAREIESLNPYVYSLEGLKDEIIERVKQEMK
jgi:hypothetical protein